MRHIPKKYIFIALSIGVALSGCSKSFLDVNKDPNRVTDDNITAELIFPAGVEEAGSYGMVGATSSQAGAKTNLQFLYSWMGYMAANGDFARDPQETSYNIDFTFNDVLWKRWFNTLFDLHQAEVKALAQGDTALAGAAIVISTKMWQQVVDLWGNVPYSQAFQVNATTTPEYDNAQDIYKSLLLRLDTAKIYLGGNLSKNFAPVDIVFKGNTDLWIKFANTLKLRLLLRQSEVSGFDPTAELAKIFGGTETGVLQRGENASENPGYANELNKQNPFYANFGYTPTDVIATSSENANIYMIDIYESTGDPREARVYDTINGGVFVGNLYGDEPGNLSSGTNSSYFGPGIIGSATQAQPLLPAYESLFMEAEARARGWTTGSAGDKYAEAVKESFTFLGVPDADNAATTYMSANAIANWANAGADAESQARFLAYQKYIANNCIDPQESYSDLRRLNFLTDDSYISANPSKVSNHLPVRVLYPQTEYTTNGTNVNKQGTIDAFTSKIFWQP